MEALYYLDEAGRLTLAPIARNRIKMAARELRRATGLGLEEIARRTHASKSQWHNYENADAPDLIPPSVFLPLEFELGQAPVTLAYTSLNGLCIGAETAPPNPADLQKLMADAPREMGEAVSVFIAAAADGNVTPNEATQIAREFADVTRIVERVKSIAASFLKRRGGMDV